MDNWRDKTALTVTDLEQILQVSRTTAYKLVREGEIPSIRIGGSIRIPVSGLRRFLGEVG